MAKIINHRTGHTQTVTKKQLDVILANPLTKNLYKVIDIKEPIELGEKKSTSKSKKPVVSKAKEKDVPDSNVGDITEPGESLSEQ
jgi:hypothetical protein